ncbi:MAG: hypothetical protein IT368_15365 [Candidatus Hydrogenedentes bacterium]|nr:hypothetical protein [Candidatus Hydrogenedentota bacterium]
MLETGVLEYFFTGLLHNFFAFLFSTVDGLVNLGTTLGINLPIIQIPQITIPPITLPF